MRKSQNGLFANTASLLICGVLAGVVVAAAAFPLVALSGLAAKASGEAFGQLPDELTVKRTPQIIYADPGLSLRRGRTNFTLSVPIRLHVNRTKSGLEERTPNAVNGGGYAKYLTFASISRTL